MDKFDSYLDKTNILNFPGMTLIKNDLDHQGQINDYN